MNTQVSGALYVLLYLLYSDRLFLSDFIRWHSGKESTYQCRRRKRCGFDSWVRRPPGEGNDNRLHYSCLGNPMNRDALQSTSPWCPKRVGHDWVTEHILIKTYTHAYEHILCTYSFNSYPCLSHFSVSWISFSKRKFLKCFSLIWFLNM